MKFLEEKELARAELITPSPMNPRLKGLTPEEPSIKSLAESLKKDGQLETIIARKYSEKYEVINGDRRCTAAFQVLKWKTIRTRIFEMNDIEAMHLRLIANIKGRQDLSPMEKGKYCKDLFELLTKQDSLNFTYDQADKLTRSKYLSVISKDCDVTPGTVLNWIRLWNDYPLEARKLIASNKEDFRAGLVSPAYAVITASLAHQIREDPFLMLKLAINRKWTAVQIHAARRRIKADDLDVNIETMDEIIEEIKRGTVYRQVQFDKPTYHSFLGLATLKKVRFDDFTNFAIQYTLKNKDDFQRFVADAISGTQP